MERLSRQCFQHLQHRLYLYSHYFQKYWYRQYEAKKLWVQLFHRIDVCRFPNFDWISQHVIVFINVVIINATLCALLRTNGLLRFRLSSRTWRTNMNDHFLFGLILLWTLWYAFEGKSSKIKVTKFVKYLFGSILHLLAVLTVCSTTAAMFLDKKSMHNRFNPLVINLMLAHRLLIPAFIIKVQVQLKRFLILHEGMWSLLTMNFY